MGVDPAEASLEVAQSKDQTGQITWVHGDATTAPALGADLALMTGNVAQVLLTNDDWTRTPQAIHHALRPRGYLAFETRRPERRAWEEWVADTAGVTMDVPGIGPVERSPIEVTEVTLPFVSFRYTYRFLSDGVAVTSDSTLRFRSRDEVESSLLASDYRVLAVRDAPDRHRACSTPARRPIRRPPEVPGRSPSGSRPLHDRCVDDLPVLLPRGSV